MTVVRAKKHLGQHFLADESIARNIVGSLSDSVSNVLEIGPGMGVLTHFLFQNEHFNTLAVDIDHESIQYLHDHYPQKASQIFYADFLKMDLNSLFNGEQFSVIGNFPYNISSQILFRIIDSRERIPQAIGMFQKEVAERVAASHGSKTYGILSVLLQAYYNVEYLFTVHEHVFKPPPKVKSAVIRIDRKPVFQLQCNEILFKQVVKTTFNQRRKMIRNSIKPLLKKDGFSHPFLEKRPEQLSVDNFVELTNAVENA
jgi:16S rRNA (adenine1518-N6/adenine1519-N6)-dimethyltransferase